MKLTKLLILIIGILLILISYNKSLAQEQKLCTIHGSIYNDDLDLIKKSIVLINTTPPQREVVTNGTYSFKVPIGQYQLKVIDFNKTVYLQKINLKKEGEYVNDIVITLNNISLSNEIPIINSIFNSTINNKNSNYKEKITKIIITIYIGILLIILITSFLLIHFIKKKRKKIMDEVKIIKQIISESEKYKNRKNNKKNQEKPTKGITELEWSIIQYIKSNQGRDVTQKEIKKKFSLSDTKISLTISSLQTKDIIKKIKKGRVNIIKLSKNNNPKYN